MTASSLLSIACLLVSALCFVQSAQEKAKKWQVVAVVASPFLEAANAKGKNSGLSIDILETFKKEDSSFDYSLKEQKDGIYGDAFGNGTNTGMVNAVVSGGADFAAGDFTITKSRSKVLDFSVPYFESQFRLLVNSNYNPAKLSYFTYDVAYSMVSVQNFLANVAPKTSGADNASQAGVAAAVGVKGVVSAKVSVSPVRNLDPRLLSANLKEAVQRLLIEKSSLALIGETPSLLLQYQAHKDQLKLLPDVVSSSYFAFGVKRGNSALREKLNEYVNSVAEKGTLQELINKYIPSGCSQ